ncbi:hypothetical protein FRC03_006412 [Tulasnella sp. 419]|nr:hypothetical protein FRC03_006412 [Tulasnella sp. 419]
MASVVDQHPRSALRSKSSSSTIRKASQRPQELSLSNTPMVEQPKATSPHQAYFDKYPRRKTTETQENVPSTSTRRPILKSSSSSLPSTRERRVSAGKQKSSKEQRQVYAWPSVSDHEPAPDDLSSSSNDVPFPRRPHFSAGSSRATRPTRPKAPSSGLDSPSFHPLNSFSNHASFLNRTSTSSTHTQTTLNTDIFTPPRTPTSSYSRSDRVLVAAPSASVETMDALVDQMTGGHNHDTDYLTSMFHRPSSSAKKPGSGLRSSMKQLRHHPLYHPPLPAPPQGITLGTSTSTESETNTDGDEGEKSTTSSSNDQRKMVKPSSSSHSKNSIKVSSSTSTIAARSGSANGPPAAPGRSNSETTLKLPRSAGHSDLASVVPGSSTTGTYYHHRRTASKDKKHGVHSERTRHRGSKEKNRLRADSATAADTYSPQTSPPLPSSDVGHSTQRQRTSSRSSAKGPGMSTNPSIDDIIKTHAAAGNLKSSLKNSAVVPSISDIIRTHAAAYENTKRIPRLIATGQSAHPPSSFVAPLTKPLNPSPKHAEDEESAGGDELHARSSMDSITAEVVDTIKRVAENAPPTPSQSQPPKRSLHHAKSFGDRPKAMSVPGKESPNISRPSLGEDYFKNGGPRSEGRGGGDAYSMYSGNSRGGGGRPSTMYSTASAPPASSSAMSPNAATLEIAQYLRSPRLTRLLTLRRHPHTGLTVSLADVGSPMGHPVIVYLGLGCVRYLIALYDEMAEALGLRLICIDRWGLGRTGEPTKEGGRGLLEWASVVDEVASMLDLKEWSVVAHSAGAPYALASTLRLGTKIKGSVHLMAPWVSVGVDGGYKWLKYVPNGLIRTAQAAEWKVQGWMLGKPPTITYQAIEYDVNAPVSSNAVSYDLVPESPVQSEQQHLEVPQQQDKDRCSTSFEYDDLADFEGRFGSSESTLGLGFHGGEVGVGHQQQQQTGKKKGFMGLFEGGSVGGKARSRTNSVNSKAESLPPTLGDSGGYSTKTRPKTAGSMGKSVKSMNQTGLGFKPAPLSLPRRPSEPYTPPPVPGLNVAVDEDLSATITDLASPVQPQSIMPPTRRSFSLNHSSHAQQKNRAANGGLSAPHSPALDVYASPAELLPLPSSPAPSHSTTGTATQGAPFSFGGGAAPGSRLTLANALLQASHAESLKGGTADLLAILERDSKPWGFSYADVKHRVKVWYGDKDEKIGISSVRWMERVMRDCEVKIVKNGGHSLMTNVDVVVEVLESVAKEWAEKERREEDAEERRKVREKELKEREMKEREMELEKERERLRKSSRKSKKHR